MLESKLRYSKTESRNVEVAKMVEFIKTCDQYPRKFHFDLFNLKNVKNTHEGVLLLVKQQSWSLQFY